MNDLNFFEFYNGKKRSRIDKDFIFYVAILAVVLCVLIYTVVNAIRLREFNNDVLELVKQIEAKKTDSKIKEIAFKEEETNKYNEIYSRLKIVDDFISTKDVINEALLHEIAAKVPEALFLKSIYVNSNSLTIEGLSKEKKLISDFEYKLSEVESFNEIFIPAIYEENEYFSFSINIKLKDVNKNGE